MGGISSIKVIEKVQAELRNEYDIRAERKRELEFLEKGGNPLDFAFGTSTSVSVQSTSFPNHHHGPVTSEAKDSFACTASLLGDSVESSGGPAAPCCEPNIADNLMLFDVECEHSEDRSSFRLIRSNTIPLGEFIEMDGNHKTRESGDSSAPNLPGKAYQRRHRSRSNRDGVRSSSNSVNLALGCHGSSLNSRHSPRDVVELRSDAVKLDISANRYFNLRSSTDNSLASDDHRDVKTDGVKAVESTEHLVRDAVSDAIAYNSPLDQINQPSLIDDTKTPINVGYERPTAFQVVEEMVSADVEHRSSVAAVKVENQSSYCQVNGFIDKRGDKTTDCAHNSHGASGRNGFDFESRCLHINTNIDGNSDAETCNEIRTMVPKEYIDNQSLMPHSTQVIEGDDTVKENNEDDAIANFSVDNLGAFACNFHMQNASSTHNLEESSQGKFDLDKQKNQFDIEGMEADGCSGEESRIKSHVMFCNDSYSQDEKCCTDENKGSTGNDKSDLPVVESSKKIAAASDEVQILGCNVKIASMDEDSILKEAEIIQAKRRRISELSNLTFPLETYHKSHWGFVLEEMEWLANDFAQERLWKLAATSQVCNQAAIRYRAKMQEKGPGMMAKVVAHMLAKAVMDFWHVAENASKEVDEPIQKGGAHTIQSYATRYLKYNSSNDLNIHDEMPITPEKISKSEILDISWEDNLTEEILFYSVTCGSMETYRQLVESHVAHRERSGCNLQYEVDASACVMADNLYFEDEGETRPYSMSVAFDDRNFSKFGRKKQIHSAHTYISRAYETDSDLLPLPIRRGENKILTPQSALLTKRPGSNLNVSIPTKRVRTSSKRIVSPFSTRTSGCIQVSNKMDGSSGDTNSFEDDQSTPRGGSFAQNDLDVESGGEFEKNLLSDSAEVSTKPKKKKKAKHLNSAIQDSWQVDSNFYEQFQTDRLKRRPECYRRGSNGCDGILGQPMTKNISYSDDGPFDNISTIGGPTPPVASQKSYASHPNKFYKILSCRERGRKPKMVKMPAGLPGSGIPWSFFEDQALVVMVHDMGPNWELVSDAFNSTLQFKCIFRQAKECKERHSMLMDRTSGDWVDSADDSGSSQHYPSTLPGIPKGSARQLFQHLKEPMEDDTLRFHREKIIMIGQKLKYRKNQDPRQLQQPHSSHTAVLSQVCPNNLSGGSVLSPLDLCDAISDPDLLQLGDQGTFSSGSTVPNHGAGALMLPASSSALQGSPNMVLGNGFPSSSGPLNLSVKVNKYVVPRTTLSTDQQRMLQYNQTVSGRSSPQSSVSAPGVLLGIDRGGRVLSGGNGAGMVSISRNILLTRPGCQGIVSSSVVNPVSMVSPGMVSTNMHSGVASGQGNPTLRPREALHMMRDSQRSMMVPDHQMQVSPRTGPGISHFGGFNSHFSNQTASLPVPSYPIHLPQSNSLPLQQPQGQHSHFQGSTNGAPSPQKQAYAIRLAKERQIQHQFLQHQPHQKQQQQVAASSSSMAHVQPPPHLPESSLIQNSPLAQSQASSPAVSFSPLTSASSMTAMPQQQQKHQTLAQRFNSNALAGCNGLTNPTSKHRQRQQQSFSQPNRQHLQQRQQAPSQQQAKKIKGIDRGGPMVHQDIPIDPSQLNGVLTDMGNQKLDKQESVTSVGETEDPCASSSLKTAQHGSLFMSSQSSKQFLRQQKKCSSHETLSSKHLHQMISHSDSSPGHNLPLVPAPYLSSAHQSVSPSAMAVPMHQQLLSSGKPVNQNQSVPQRVVQPQYQFNSESLHEANADQSRIRNSIEMDDMTSLPQISNNATNGVKVVSAGIAHQWHASERKKDSNVLDPTRSLSSMVPNPANTSEVLPSANLLPITHDASSQWLQPSQIQQPHSPASPMVAVNSASPDKE